MVGGVAILLDAPAAPPDEELEVPLVMEAELSDVRASTRPITKSDRIAQTIVMALLFAGPAIMCLHGSCANDADIWWHMRTGEWILQHHAVPYVDSFSGPFAGQPWLAYSWLFELVVAKLFQWLGLVGIAAYSAAMILTISVAIYHLVRRLQSDFTLSVLLTFVAMFSMGHMFTPRPWLFTILLFVLEIDILMHARRTGKLSELAWLPVIFALWANVHIQFVDGLLVLGLAVAEALAARWWTAAQKRVGPTWLGGALLASIFATLANPYGWHVYRVAYDLATQAGALNKVTELQALPFRSPSDFVILLLTLGSAGALAWHRRLASFEGALLAFSAILSFRSQRDVWIIATVAIAILASAITGRRKVIGKLPGLATGLAGVVAILAVSASFVVLHVNNSELQIQVSENMPVRAVEIIREKGFSGPLYNDFNWGGYLIQNLGLPVSIDGRQNLYGDQGMDRSVATWNGEPDWATDGQLVSARLVIGPVHTPLIQLLRIDPRFQLAYEDKVAAVFVARK